MATGYTPAKEIYEERIRLLEHQNGRLEEQVAQLQRELADRNRANAKLLDVAREDPDTSFLADLAGAIRGWAADETPPTVAYAEELGSDLEELAVALAVRGKEPE